MAGNRKQAVLGGIAAAALIAAAVLFYLHGQAATATDGDIDQSALCSSCGHYADLTQAALYALLPTEVPMAAMCPGDGPGYRCPACGKPTFYPNPITCEKCSTKFLISRDAFGAHVAKCPKCGWER
jgi:DNA-directed RNA polymerase subunit RPC12/RpoP